MSDSHASEIGFAKSIIDREAAALRDCAASLSDSFLSLVELAFSCGGRICLAGVGKSAAVANKICGTMNSVGNSTFVLDVLNAAHGDLGMLSPNDLVILFSWSGATAELKSIVKHVKNLSCHTVLITRDENADLARDVDLTVTLGFDYEADSALKIPTCSAVAMMAVGDALALCLARRRGFTTHDFRRFHPGGALGREIT